MQQVVVFEDLGMRPYKEIWDYQELLLKKNTDIKAILRHQDRLAAPVDTLSTTHHLLFVEHSPVYTLGKSGKEQHILIEENEIFVILLIYL